MSNSTRLRKIESGEMMDKRSCNNQFRTKMAAVRGTSTPPLGSQQFELLIAVMFLATVSVILHPAAAEKLPDSDFCIAELSSRTHTDGYPCKDITKVTNEDFVFRGLRGPAHSPHLSRTGAVTTQAFVTEFPALNYQGISTARIDYDPNGYNPPHWHPRGSEILTVLRGELFVAFVDAEENRLWYSNLHEGDTYVFPRGLAHYQHNIGKIPAVASIILNNQDPGQQEAGNSMFGSGIRNDVLRRSFDLNQIEVQRLKMYFGRDLMPSDQSSSIILG